MLGGERRGCQTTRDGKPEAYWGGASSSGKPTVDGMGDRGPPLGVGGAQAQRLEVGLDCVESRILACGRIGRASRSLARLGRVQPNPVRAAGNCDRHRNVSDPTHVEVLPCP
jgi:hypothetical protein